MGDRLLDSWKHVSAVGEALYHSQHLKIPEGQIDEHFEAELQKAWFWNDIDTDSWQDAPKRMVIPLKPAVGGCMVRTVMAYNFPALCLLLGDHYTAREIDTAWLLMPVVRSRKAARGAPGKGALKRRMEKGYGKGYGKRYGTGYGRKGYGR